MTAALAIAAASLRRMARDRRALFFSLVLPVLVIVVVGVSVRGFGTAAIGVVGGSSGPAARELADALAASPALTVQPLASRAEAATAVRRSELAAAVLVPPRLDAQLAGRGHVEIGVLAEQANPTQQAAIVAIRAALARFSGRIEAARFATDQVGGKFRANLELATRLEPVVGQVRTRTVVADASYQTLPEGFGYSAPTMLVLFVFLNAVAGGAAMVATRRQGIYERALAAPVTPASIVTGELLAMLALALAQGALIVGIGAVAFGVTWGDPLAVAVLLLLWALVGAGAGALAGSLFRTPEQAGAIGPLIGIAFGMLGGCMWPLSIVGPTMRVVGHFTPHAWAVDAWTMLIAGRAGLAAVAPKLWVIAAFAAGFLLLAGARFRWTLGEKRSARPAAVARRRTPVQHR